MSVENEINEEELLSQIQEEILAVAEELEHEISEEDLMELSKKTLGSYIKHSEKERDELLKDKDFEALRGNHGAVAAAQHMVSKRNKGMATAKKKLTKEEFEELIEKAFRGEGDEDKNREKQRDLQRKKAREGKQKTRVMEAIDEMLAAAHENKPVEFAAAFNAAMQSRVADSINALRPEIAAGMFSPSEE